MSRRRHRDPSHQLEQVAHTLANVAGEAQRMVRRRRRRHGRRGSQLGKIVRAVLWAAFATLALVPLMFAFGFGIGWQAALSLPVLLMAIYGGLLHWVLKRPEPPRLPAGSATQQEIALLPEKTDTWLESERGRVPREAQQKIDTIALRLEQLEPQLASLPADTPGAREARRIMSDELPTLLSSFHKVPRALQQQPLYGGPTPERQLVDGLETIDKELARLHEQLAQDDLKALAVHERYLDMKYNRKDGVD